MVGRGDLQETTRLIGEATSVVNMFVILLSCGCAAWPIQTHFIKNLIIFSLNNYCREASRTSMERGTSSFSSQSDWNTLFLLSDKTHLP